MSDTDRYFIREESNQFGKIEMMMHLGDFPPFRMKNEISASAWFAQVRKNQAAANGDDDDAKIAANDVYLLLAPFVRAGERDRLRAAVDSDGTLNADGTPNADEEGPVVTLPGAKLVAVACQKRYLAGADEDGAANP